MDGETRTIVRAVCEEMAEIKNLLRSIYVAVSPKGEMGGEDLVYQFPESMAAFTLPAGGTYARDMTVNRRLMYLSVDAPEGVIISVYRDNTFWMFASSEIGAMEFKKGVYFGDVRIEVRNTTEVNQNWSIRFIFC
jgi:predicted peptidase